jgi:ribosomal protein L11 methyltransferase
LRLLAPVLCAHLKPDGYLVLAGILERQADEIAAAYQPYVKLRVLDQQDGWILMGR